MVFRSTRTPTHRAGMEEAVFRGLAPDGGLYVPVEHPHLNSEHGQSFSDLSRILSRVLVGPVLGQDTADNVARAAFPFQPVLRPLGDGLYVLELFHGPSCAFKDYGASYLATVMDAFCARVSRTATVLVATSGDTGSAVAQAFRGRSNLSVVILYPSGRVSDLQERQLTTVGGNVRALEVEGSFDDCQRMVKGAFQDTGFASEQHLTSANSINVGRFLPQALYYLWAASVLPESPVFVVPSGNLGNLCSGLYAWKWGMPVVGFLAATNANDVLPRYLTTGRFDPRVSLRTLSNAMDVGDPSNMERLRDLLEGDTTRAPPVLAGESVTDPQTIDGMRDAYQRYGYVMDPHTAVGYVAQGRRATGGKGPPVVLLATAHPAKFVETVREALGIEPELPEALKRAAVGRKVAVRIPPTHDALAAFLRSDTR